MRRLNWRYFLLVQMALNLFVYSCRNIHQTAYDQPLKRRPAKFILDECRQNAFEPDWCGMKLDAELLSGEESQSFKATVRMRRDSIIWISIAPMLGIEMIRLIVTPDSLKYLSKIPDQKFYYLGSISELSDKTGADLSFSVLQDILCGNPVGFEDDAMKFRSEIDSMHYLLISKYKRKVRKVVGKDDRRLENDSIHVDFDDPRVSKKIKKLSDDGIVISRYWINAETFRLNKSVFDDIIHRRNFQIDFANHELLNEQWIPKKCSMKLVNDGATLEVRYDVDRISTGKPYDFPFEISDDIPRRDTL
jgi:hypothetical protein